MRIVFIRLRSLGDIVLMTPVLAVAKRKPGTVVGVVCETPFDEVLEGNPDVDVLINAPRRKAWLSRVTAIREVRLSLIHISEPTRHTSQSRMPACA